MIELTTSLLMIASIFSANPTPVVAETSGIVLDGGVQATTTVNEPIIATTTEDYVRSYFKDTPILAEIAGCESSFRQFDKDGKPLRGAVNRGDIGIMQINRYYHEEDAVKLGFDIYTVDGNLGFAKVLYKKYGNNPWSSSAKCWANPKIDTTKIARA